MTSVSCGSRVVCGMSLTITLSSPISLLKSEDFPTFGFPINVTENDAFTDTPSSFTFDRFTCFVRSTIISRRSPVFFPLAAERGNGSPRPSLYQAASVRLRSCFLLSALFAMRMTGFCSIRLRCFASSCSCGKMPVCASVTNKMISASFMAALDCSRISFSKGISSVNVSPPVSMMRNSSPRQMISPSLFVRVVPGTSEIIAFGLSINLLNNVDFPTLTHPTSAIVGSVRFSCVYRFVILFFKILSQDDEHLGPRRMTEIFLRLFNRYLECSFYCLGSVFSKWVKVIDCTFHDWTFICVAENGY